MVTDRAWLPAPAHPSLEAGAVHVWRLALDERTCHSFRPMVLLSGDERLRAERFHFQSDSDRFVASRSVLRILLGRYTRSEPRSIPFTYSAHGKPFLPADWRETSIRFNLSHSGEYTLYAFSNDREVGIDIEHIRPLVDMETIATQVFTRGERDLIARASDDDKEALFFRLWSRKEAHVKAIGHGLSRPLQEISVLGSVVEAAGRDGHSDESHRWSVQDIDCASNYAAALVTEGQPSTVIRWQWIEPRDHIR